MKKTLLILTSIVCAVVSVFGQNPTTLWQDNEDIQWYNTQDAVFNLSTSAELAGLSKLVAGGNNFAGKTILLDASLDLGDHLWTPIGVGASNAFSGTFNGNSHLINNLIVDLPEKSFVGLFGRCIECKLSNVLLEAPSIRGEDNVGSLLGNAWKNVVIENCHAIGVDVIASGDNIGGLVGDMLENSSMFQCSSDGNVIGGSQVGGLLGTPYNGNTIKQCYSGGTVYAGHLAGGLIGATTIGIPGTTESFVEDCYSRTTVKVVNGIAGGFIGNFPSLLNVKNSYSTGTAEGPELLGGFIGWAGNVVTENNYWDTESSQKIDAIGDWQSPTPGVFDITGKTTAEMKTSAMVDALNNGSGPWIIDPSKNDGYPTFIGGDLSVPSWTKENISLNVYPNVFNDEIHVDADAELISYAIYEISGKVIQTGGMNGSEYTIDTQLLNAGIYLLIVNTNKASISKRIVKQ